MKRLDIHKLIKPDTFHIWTDGSFRPDGSAACAYLIFSEAEQKVVKAAAVAFRGRTINQMELMAINVALDFPGMNNIIIYSDSAYSISCLTTWRKSWVSRNWTTPLGEPVKNRELIEETGKKIDAKPSVRFIKVEAHGSDYFNSVVDGMATRLTKKMVENPNLPDGEHVV